MKIEHTEIHGFKAALRGMRNPFDSWDKSDSWIFHHAASDDAYGMVQYFQKPHWPINEVVDEEDEAYTAALVSTGNRDICPPFFIVREMPVIGPDDLQLARNLIKRGGDHRKFLRYIIVTCDITIPRYVWQEVDTYKIGTVRNSCSTMNTLGKRYLTQDDFESPLPQLFLNELNKAVDDFREASGGKAKRTERVTMKDLLPEGFLQKATFLLNYEVGFRMYFSRRGHRLPMWREGCEGSICEWIKSWPYMNSFLEGL